DARPLLVVEVGRRVPGLAAHVDPALLVEGDALVLQQGAHLLLAAEGPPAGERAVLADDALGRDPLVPGRLVHDPADHPGAAGKPDRRAERAVGRHAPGRAGPHQRVYPAAELCRLVPTDCHATTPRGVIPAQ